MRSLMGGFPNYPKLVFDCLKFIHLCRDANHQIPQKKALIKDILQNGREYIQLNFSQDEIELILKERLSRTIESYRQIAMSFAALAKYPPAFGLVGTVFGLVNLMRGLSEGMV